VSVVECLFYIHNCFATISFFNCKKIMNEEWSPQWTQCSI
jgi:hypothetical protein